MSGSHLDLDDLERRARAAISDTRAQVCWHDARTALALIERVREMEAVVDAVLEVDRLDRLCLDHHRMDDQIGQAAENALPAAVRRRSDAIAEYRRKHQ